MATLSTPESIETSRHLTPDTKADLRTLAAQVSLSDQALALIANAREEARHEPEAGSQPEALFLLARDHNGSLRAAAVVDLRLNPPVAEFMVDLELKTGLDDAADWAQVLFDELANNPPASKLSIWDHGADTPIGQLALARAWPINRSLVIMESSLLEQVANPAHAEDNSHVPDQMRIPDGCQLRPFDPDTDETAWLELNRRAFVDLPDQSSWTLADLRARYSEPWFDREGFLVLADSTGKLLGAHWTKYLPEQVGEQEGGAGEVYVLAVAPDWAGQGLGALLTHAGLNHLASKGATKVQLYVDSTNEKALALYHKTGFTEVARDTQYLAPL